MKIFHLSDLHIGLKLINRDLREDQEYIFKQIADQVSKEKPDAIVIAGDIFNVSVPSAESVEVFDSFIKDLTQAAPDAYIMMISGNHDSAQRVNLYRSLLSKNKLYMIGNPPSKPEDYIEKVSIRDEKGIVNFYLLPFVKPSMIKHIVGCDENGNNLSYNDSIHRLIEREHINSAERNVLVSHQFYLPAGSDPEKMERADSETVTVGNIDQVSADVLAYFDYAALGHIHKPMKVGSEIYRYCGTPLACSVSEAGQQKGIIVVEMKEKGNVTTSVIPLKPLHEVRKIQGSLEDILKEESEDYVSITLTDEVDFDVFDLQDRIKRAFPNHLEINRIRNSNKRVNREIHSEREMDPFELCCAFLNDPDDSVKELLMDVINTVKGGK